MQIIFLHLVCWDKIPAQLFCMYFKILRFYGAVCELWKYSGSKSKKSVQMF